MIEALAEQLERIDERVTANARLGVAVEALAVNLDTLTADMEKLGTNVRSLSDQMEALSNLSRQVNELSEVESERQRDAQEAAIERRGQEKLAAAMGFVLPSATETTGVGPNPLSPPSLTGLQATVSKPPAWAQHANYAAEILGTKAGLAAMATIVALGLGRTAVTSASDAVVAVVEAYESHTATPTPTPAPLPPLGPKPTPN